MLGLALLSFLLCATHSLSSDPWDNDVYCGRHFDDLVTATTKKDDVMIWSTILVLYDNMCKSTVVDHFDLTLLPPENMIVLAKHNMADADFHIWYGVDEVDNLRARYNFTQCPEVMFFPKGGSLYQPTRIAPGEPINTFIWKQFKLTVKLINRENVPLKVKFKGHGPVVHTTTLQAGELREVRAYKSYLMMVYNGRDGVFLMGQLLNSTSDQLTVILSAVTFQNTLDARQWEAGVREVEDNAIREIRWWRGTIAHGYLLGFKQPVLLPKFSKEMKGYEARKQPEQVQKLLLDYYRTNRPTKLQPEPERVEPLINDDDVKCGMVPLPDELRDEIADILLPVMEEWAGTRLKMTYLYGIREYYQNNILRMHVDRVDTHIVSVILQIDQDLGGAGPWELELIDFDGIRRNVTLDVGDMMLYESATLIHGRPYPFKGVRFANAFLHYVPYSNWRWRRTSTHTITNGTIEEPIDRFVTVNTAKFNQWNVRHKWTDLPYHDEL